MATTLGQAYVQIMPSAKGISGSIQKAINPEAVAAGKSAGRNISESISRAMGQLGSSMKQVGKKLTTNLTLPIAGVGIAATKIGSSFESSMSKVAAISGATGKDLEKLTKKAREMGATTIFSASESADALNYMALAGWDTHEMLDGISGVMALAAASGEDLALVSDIVTDGLSAFGLQAKEASRMADVLAAASANSNTNVDMLGQAFAYVAPVAGALGFTIEDTSKAIGLMSNAGIKSTKAGTALRAMMTNLAKPTESMHKAMQELGISLTDSQGNMKSFDDIMRDLRKSFANLSEDQQASAAATLFGKEAMSGALAIINASSDDFEKLGHAINNSEGAANNMAKTMQDNLQGRFKEMQSVLEDVAITVYDNIKPALEIIIDNIAKAAKWFGNLSPKIQSTIVVIAGLVMGLGPLVMFAGLLASSISALIPILAALFSPVGLIIGAIAALTAGIVYLWQTNESFKGFITKVWEQIKTAIMIPIETVSNFIKDVWGGLVDWWNESGERIKEAAENVWNFVSKAIEIAMDVIWSIMQFVWPLVEILIVQVWENIKGVISGAIDVITGIIDFFAALFTGNWSALWESVKKIISGAVKFLWNLINLYFIGRILGIARNFVGIFGNVIRGGWNTIRGLFSGGLGAVRNLVSTGLGAVRNTFSNIMNGLRNIVSGAFNRVRSSISTGMNNALNAVKNFFGKFKDAGRRIVTSIADGIKGAISTVTNAIKGVTQKVRNFLPFSPPKEGPMKDIMKVQWGPTIAEGILKGEDVVAEAMNRLLDHQYSFHSDVQPQKRSDSDTLLREQNELLKLLLQKDQEIIVDGDVLFKLTDKRLTSTFDLDTYLRGERV